MQHKKRNITFDWVKKTSKKKLVMGGLWTESCLLMASLSALHAGYEVYIVTDASSSGSLESHNVAVHRMTQAGCIPITAGIYLKELQREWAGTETATQVRELYTREGTAHGQAVRWYRDSSSSIRCLIGSFRKTSPNYDSLVARDVQDSIASPKGVHIKPFAEEMMVIIEANISKIETMEDLRYAAMLYKDVKMLRSILHDQLTYVHSSGVTDTKASYIAGLETGVWDYRCIRRSKQTIKVQASLALVFNLLSINIAVRDYLVRMENRALAVWIYEANIWRLIAVQSSAIVPSAKVTSV